MWEPRHLHYYSSLDVSSYCLSLRLCVFLCWFKIEISYFLRQAAVGANLGAAAAPQIYILSVGIEINSYTLLPQCL
jgi:hypothetical protein